MPGHIKTKVSSDVTFSCIKNKDLSDVSKQHCIRVNRSSSIYTKAEARSGAVVRVASFL